ncbi:MAG: GIY-YIG nuclease family protein [Phycisphaerales bacterium]
MVFYVYVIESISTKRRYVGQTSDLERRLIEHNNPEHNPVKYTTKQACPWRLVHQEQYPSLSEAMKRERWLKSRTGR